MLSAKDRTIGASRGQRRAGYFDDCLPLFEAPRKGVTDHGFARVAGRYQGRLFDLQAVPDALSYRKLPCLWLLVTLTEPMPVGGTLDIMMRPAGGEVFSNFGALTGRVTLPATFPDRAQARTDGAGALPPEALVADQAGLFARPRVKELVLSPKGLRLVWLAEEADRGRYLIFRDSEVGAAPLAPAVIQSLMDDLIALAASLEGTP